MKIIKNQIFKEERALYNSKNIEVINCIFNGDDYSESSLKESENITVKNCVFNCNYSLWHLTNSTFIESNITELTRASLWYCNKLNLIDTSISGVKAIRESNNINVNNCSISSDEPFWKCNNINVTKSNINGEYAFLESKNIKISDLNFKGKYSFQYIENMELTTSSLDTKDAFWHAKNTIVKNCTIKGEYIAWYSENLTIIDSKIIGKQPFCYCKNLKLVNCEMEDADFAFEYSSVEADIKSKLISIKNPLSGHIKCFGCDQVILDKSKYPTNCKIEIIN